MPVALAKSGGSVSTRALEFSPIEFADTMQVCRSGDRVERRREISQTGGEET